MAYLLADTAMRHGGISAMRHGGILLMIVTSLMMMTNFG
jgi:hypothetical protein